MICLRLVHKSLFQVANKWSQLVNEFFMTCSCRLHDFFMTCPRLIHDSFFTWPWLVHHFFTFVHELFTNVLCSWLASQFSKTSSLVYKYFIWTTLLHNLFTICVRLVDNFCSQFRSKLLSKLFLKLLFTNFAQKFFINIFCSQLLLSNLLCSSFL